MCRADKILLSLCASFILIIGIVIFILPQADFSESENRYLAKAPSFSASKLFSGDYTRELSSFYSDQFPMRSAATTLYSLCERAMGKKNVGGVICYESRLIAIPRAKEPQKELPIPAVCVKSKYSLFKSQSDDISLYYNTDHHRTTYGAYLLYLEACQALNVKPYPESYFQKETVCNDFYGTAFFKSRLPKFAVKPDTIELWRYCGDEDVIFTVNGTNKKSVGFYDFSKLNSTDKYAIFLGGNYAHATILSRPENPTLLLFKDSFANAVIPFLALHFNIEVIDPRYTTKSQLSSFYNGSYDYRLFLGCLESFN